MTTETKSDCNEDVSKCDFVIRIIAALKYCDSIQDNDKFQYFCNKMYGGEIESDYLHIFQHHRNQKEAILQLVKSQKQLDKCLFFNCSYIERCMEPIELDTYVICRDDQNYRDYIIDPLHCWLYHVDEDKITLNQQDSDESEDSYEDPFADISFVIKETLKLKISASALNTIDYALSKYYHALNTPYYVNGKPKFSNYLSENGYTNHNIDQQLRISTEKNILVKFDDNFPFHAKVIIKDEMDRNNKILLILRHCLQYGCCPNVIISGYEVNNNTRLDPLARLILMAVYDDNNIWSKLAGMRYIVKHIWEMALQFNQQYICKDDIIAARQFTVDEWRYYYKRLLDPELGMHYIDINMMPFYMYPYFEKTKLPKYLKRYSELIRFICGRDPTQRGKVCYLTVQESLIEKGKTQRRPGLHVESPGNMVLKREELSEMDPKKDFIFSDDVDLKGYTGSFGTGDNKGKGGIYMVTNIEKSCAIWNCSVENDMIGHLGDIEHLRGSLPNDKKRLVEANKLYWITDRTPHEALPMKQDGFRIFFRLVTHQLSFWYEQHCTANPNGVVPDPDITRIIHVNKFSK